MPACYNSYSAKFQHDAFSSQFHCKGLIGSGDYRKIKTKIYKTNQNNHKKNKTHTFLNQINDKDCNEENLVRLFLKIECSMP